MKKILLFLIIASVYSLAQENKLMRQLDVDSVLTDYVVKDSIMTWDAMVDSLGYVKPEQYGALKDDGVDDATAFGNTIASGDSIIIKLSAGTYTINSVIDLQSNTTFIGENTIIDASAITSGGVFQHRITASDTSLLSSSVSAGQDTIIVADASLYTVDEWIQIGSDAELSDGFKRGEAIRIKDISGDTIALHAPLLLSYSTTDNALVRKKYELKNIIFKGITFKGSSVNTENNNYGIFIDGAENVKIYDCNFENIHYAGIHLYDVINFKVENCDFKDSYKTGISYGIELTGSCANGVLQGNAGDNLRHLVTMGQGSASFGAPNFVSVLNNLAYNMRDAGFDTHPGSIGIEFIGNTVNGSLLDGIVIQNGDAVVSGNMVTNCTRYGILAQNMTFLPTSYIIANNQIRRTGSSGIVVDNKDEYNLFSGILIESNIIDSTGGYGIDIGSVITSNFSNYTIINNTILNTYSSGMYLRYLNDLTVKDNIVKRNVETATGSGISVEHSNRVNIESNIIDKYFNGIYCVSTNNVYSNSFVNNTITNFSDGAVGIYLDQNKKSTIIGNKISDDKQSPSNDIGIYLVDSDTNLVSNNVIDSLSMGIRLYNSTYTDFNMNTIMNTNYGIYSDATSTGIRASYNRFLNTTSVWSGRLPDAKAWKNDGLTSTDDGIDGVTGLQNALDNKLKANYLSDNLIPEESSLFETNGIAYWDTAQGYTSAVDWNPSGYLTMTSATVGYIYASINPYDVSASYSYAFKVKSDGYTGTVSMFASSNEAPHRLVSGAVSSAWQSFTGFITTPETPFSTYLQLQSSYAGTVDFDSIVVKRLENDAITDTNAVYKFNGSAFVPVPVYYTNVKGDSASLPTEILMPSIPSDSTGLPTGTLYFDKTTGAIRRKF